MTTDEAIQMGIMYQWASKQKVITSLALDLCQASDSPTTTWRLDVTIYTDRFLYINKSAPTVTGVMQKFSADWQAKKFVDYRYFEGIK